jgi:hypothetical protein
MNLLNQFDSAQSSEFSFAFARFCRLLGPLPPFLYHLGHLVYLPFQLLAGILELLHDLLFQIFLLRTFVFQNLSLAEVAQE